jgi:glycosyltransferase involved in cell wall biosynthesis
MAELSKVVCSISAIPTWTMGGRAGMPSVVEVQRGYVQSGWEAHFFYMYAVRLRMIRRRFLWTVSQKLYWLAFAVRAVWVVRRTRMPRPDVVYAHSHYGALPAAILRTMWHCKSVYRGYGTLLRTDDRGILLYDRMCRFDECASLMLPFDLYVLTNDGTRLDKVVAFLGVPQSKTLFLTNGVDRLPTSSGYERVQFRIGLGIAAAAPVILSVERLVPWKRVDRAVGVMRLVLAQLPNARLVVVGSGEELEHLREQTRREGVEEQVLFAGRVDHSQLGDYYDMCDCLLSTNDISNLSNPVLEAMSCGRAVVTLDNGGTQDLVKNGVNGFLVPPDDTAALADMLVRVLSDAPLRAAIGRAASECIVTDFRSWRERADVEIRAVTAIIGEARPVTR